MMIPPHSVYYLEIVTSDVAQVRASYEQVHGWSFRATGPELGHSLLAELPNGGRCGIRAPMHEQEKPVMRTYIRVDDLERAVELARASGAFVALPPMDLPGHGRIAIYMLGGVEHALWQLP